MKINDEVFREFVKNGYAEKDGRKTWDISERWFLYSTPELAKGFLKLRKFDKYRKQVVERELGLMKKNSKKLSKGLIKEPFNLIDVFCGDGKKAVEFLKLVDGTSDVRYCPLNVNEHLTSLATKNVKRAGFRHVSEIVAHHGLCDGESVGKIAKGLRNKRYKRNVLLLLGSVLASYEINDYLYGLSKSMTDGDYLIIGNGIRVGERLASLETYRNKVWNNWFIKLVESLGVDKKAVEYDARFGNDRVEMFYRIKRGHKVKNGNKEVEFKEGDEVLTAILYKYYAQELKKFCKMYFKDVELVKDEDSEYALVVCRK